MEAKLVGALCACVCAVLCGAQEADSGERALQDALLLVQLLKSAQAGSQLSPLRQLAPLTTRPNRRAGWQPDRLQNRRQFRAPAYYYDMPMRRYFRGGDNYGNQPRNVWRRIDYEDPFGPAEDAASANSRALGSPTVASTTASTTPTTTATTTTTTITTTTASARPAQASSSVAADVATSDAPHTLRTTAAVQASPLGKTTRTSYTRTRQKPVTKRETLSQQKSNKDTIMSQVAAEIINELEDSKFKVKKSVKSSAGAAGAGTGAGTGVRKITIHLGRSTRYPIPLPENHAFCFTNPNNPLCRTYIR